MHARSTRSETRCHATCCLCLHCFAPLKIVNILGMLLKHSLSTVGGHRPIYNITGRGKMVIDQKWGSRPDFSSRPALKMADRPSLPAESCFCCSRGQTVHGKVFTRQYMHDHPPYHAANSREYGSRSSGHQSRISMHDGQRCQVCKSM